MASHLLSLMGFLLVTLEEKSEDLGASEVRCLLRTRIRVNARSSMVLQGFPTDILPIFNSSMDWLFAC
jgi:hypothetical protein